MQRKSRVKYYDFELFQFERANREIMRINVSSQQFSK